MAKDECLQPGHVAFLSLQGKEKAAFHVELAADPKAQEKGLMYRTDLPDNKGMWFVFERAYRVGMWMKNTLIPLDMIFVDEAGVVRHIEHEAEPESLILRQSPVDVRFVLEIAGGEAKRKHIAPGDRVRCYKIHTHSSAYSL